MANGDEKILAQVRSFLERHKLEATEVEEQNCTKVTTRSGAQSASVNVYNSGKLVVGGKDSPLRTLLTQMKEGLEGGTALPGEILPFEIDRFPTTMRERVPTVDPVIVRFIEEAISCFRAGALLGAAFMLGAASEKAINLLVEGYSAAIADEGNRTAFQQRAGGNKFISKRFDEFKRSYGGCRPKPTGPLFNDIDVMIGATFQFCRITRNDIGHPQIVPDLDRGVLLANLGHFLTYIERVYALIAHFNTTPITV